MRLRWRIRTGVGERGVDVVRTGSVERAVFLVGGCDGAEPGRNYFSDFAHNAPQDSLVMTLGCGKYRIRGHDYGTHLGFPRLMDMGQCNDAFSAVKVAMALANAFGTDVNGLPLSLVLSWFEQKAAAVLLTLLSLGIRNIRLGPTLPAFLTPAVIDILVDKFALKPIGDPAQDLADAMAGA